LYTTHALKNIPFESFTNGFYFDTQIILALAERGMRICEMPVPTYYGDEICHVNGIPYAMNCIIQSYKYYRNRKRGVLTFPGPVDVPKIEVQQVGNG
jgi:hypothetical protein